MSALAAALAAKRTELKAVETREYKLSDANLALQDLHHGKISGRAVLVP